MSVPSHESVDSLVQIRGLSVRYASRGGGEVCALEDVRLGLGGREILGILGESGSGKSTLATAVLGLLPAHARIEEGTILFRGRDLLGMPARDLRAIRGREIAMIPQDPALVLNPVITSGEQIGEVLRAHLPLSRSARRERVYELLGEVGFDAPGEIYGVYPHQLSGGQRQRVVIAQAIACRPALVIADEPTSKLDSQLRQEIGALLSRMRAAHGTALLVISHDAAFIASLADRVALMYAGRVVEAGSCEEIFRRPLHPYTQALVGIARAAAASTCGDAGRCTGDSLAGSERSKGHTLRVGAKERFPRIDGEFSESARAHAGCSFEPRCTERMEICGQRRPRQLAAEGMRLVSCFKYGE
jgi:peptide/nickel transport system ATP-binding protein